MAPVSWCDRAHGGFEAAVARVGQVPTGEAEALAFAVAARWHRLAAAQSELVAPEVVRQLQVVREVLPAAAGAGGSAEALAEARALDQMLDRHC
jgi:hypothetical protein